MSLILGEPICASETVATLGEFFVDDVSMHIDGAWNCTNPNVLWIGNAVKGSNRNKPRARGSRANRYRGAESTYSLQMIIDGRYDVVEQDWADNVWAGLQHNLRWLKANVVDLEDAPARTRTGTLYLPDGDALQGPVQCRTLIHQNTELDVFTAVMTVVVPGHELQLLPS